MMFKEEYNSEILRYSKLLIYNISTGNPPTMQEMEIGMKNAALKDGAKVLSKIISELSDSMKEIHCRKCDGEMINIGMRSKEIVSLLGAGAIKRRYYECTNPKCKNHYFPKDKMLNIENTSFTPGVRRIMAKTGSDSSFQKASKDIKDYCGLEIGAKDIERVAEDIGVELEKSDIKKQNKLFSRKTISEPTEKFLKETTRMYIEYDGTGVPSTLKELKGRKGKQEDGTAKTREAKLGCIFTQTSVDKDGAPVRDENSTTYFGAIENSDKFGRRVYTEAIARGFGTAKEVIIIGDGAKWIRNIADEHFFGATQIVDMYHAKEHLHGLIKLMFTDKEKQTLIIEKWEKLLENGKIMELTQEITLENLTKIPTSKIIEREINYFKENSSRMQYSNFKERGLFVGSGVIEAGCKNIIGKRLKQSGMRWSHKGANAIIALRCGLYSEKFDEFWEKQQAA